MLGGRDDSDSADFCGVVDCCAARPGQGSRRRDAVRGVAGFRFGALLGNGSGGIGRLANSVGNIRRKASRGGVRVGAGVTIKV